MMMLTGVQSLMLAVLDQAVSDLQAANASIRWQARAWFFAPVATTHLFSFAQICRELGRDPYIVRAQLLIDELAADASGAGDDIGCSRPSGPPPRRRPRATPRRLLMLS